MSRPWRAAWGGPAVFVGLACSCGAIEPPPGSPAPINACQTYEDCAAYQTLGACAGGASNAPPAECLGGRCIVAPDDISSQSLLTRAVAVVSLAKNALNGAGKTFALPLATLLRSTCPERTPAGGICLPSLVPVNGVLFCEPSAAKDASYNLGGIQVVLPVRATFTPRWANGKTETDATTYGLPLSSIIADTTPDDVLPGPGGGPGTHFSVQDGLPPLIYERTLMPLAPFDAVFPPDVSDIDLGAKVAPTESVTFAGFDPTNATGGSLTLPTFTLSRADGAALDGWTAYLRDLTTLRRFSLLASLQGTQAKVTLLTHHNMTEAVTNGQLVMAPPPNSALPTWLFIPDGTGNVPKVPTPFPTQVSVIDAVSRQPAAADLVFEATGICKYTGNMLQLDTNVGVDFEFETRIPADAGAATVTLPLGNYRVAALPRNRPSAVTFVPVFPLADSNCNPLPPSPIQLQRTSQVTGTAAVADGRPLAAATVEFVPALCEGGSHDLNCLPRSVQTVTATNGAYSAQVDPGVYMLRVRPAQGSGLPWVVQTPVTTPTTTPLCTSIPAPFHQSAQLFDSLGDSAAEALVQIFVTPPQASGPPTEIAEAITDTSGHFDLYLDPTAQ